MRQYIPHCTYRFTVEEAMLGEQLGEPYRTYQQRTARLVPRVF